MGADFSRTLLVALCFAGTCLPAFADIVTDGSAGPALRLNGPEFQIGAELGTQAGRNLFHSFERFNLQTGERATFSGPDAIKNVIGRVTGGARSEIDGTIRSTIPGANFFFINPSGIVFGPNAALDLQGSFHVSTADEVRFTDGARFNASTPAGSSFTVASPEAFGFIGGQPAPILVDRSTLAVPRGESLSLVGGEISVLGGVEESAAVIAQAGRIDLFAGAAEGEAAIGRDSDALLGGRIRIARFASIRADGDGGGVIRIRAAELVLDEFSFVRADNVGDAGDGGLIDIHASNVSVSGGSQIRATASAAGPGGTILMEADQVLVAGGLSTITSGTASSGNAGTVRIHAAAVEVRDDGTISSELAIHDGQVRLALVAG